MQDQAQLYKRIGEDFLALAQHLEGQKGDIETRLIAEHGEVVNKSEAKAILRVGNDTINKMLKDGRLEPACEGRRISVSSIAHYMTNKKKMDWDAKIAQRRKALGR